MIWSIFSSLFPSSACVKYQNFKTLILCNLWGKKIQQISISMLTGTQFRLIWTTMCVSIHTHVCMYTLTYVDRHVSRDFLFQGSPTDLKSSTSLDFPCPVTQILDTMILTRKWPHCSFICGQTLCIMGKNKQTNE